MRCGFWPLIYSWEYPFSSQSFPSDNTAGVLSRTFKVKKISNSLTYKIASSCVCTSPLAVMTIVGLHDLVKISISASLKSFLLIMCIDAPESSTNFRSSSLRFDAGRHLFSEGDKNVALSCSFNFNTLLTSFHAASRAPCSCHSVSSWDRFLTFWSVGATLMRITWANISERRICASNFRVTCNSLCEFHTLDWLPHVCALPENRLRRRHVLKYATQLPCIRWSTLRWLLSQLLITPLIMFPRSIVTLVSNRSSFLPIIFLQSHCTFVIIILRLCRLFINLTVCLWALFPKPTTTLRLVEHSGGCYCKFLRGNPCRAIETFYHWDSFLWDFGFSMLFAHSAAWKKFRNGFGCVTFPRLLISWRKLQLSPFTHCPLVSHSQQSPRILCTRCFVPWFLTTAFFSKFPLMIPKFLFWTSCSILLFTIVFNLWESGPNFFWWVSRSYNFEYGLEFLRLSYSYFVQSSQDVIKWDFRHRQWNSVPLWVEFLNIVISKNNSK